MFIRLLTIVMAFALVISTAGASTTSGLRQAFDELNYSLVVEWDQKDAEFRNEQLSVFHNKINELNLTQEELISFVKSEVKDARLAKDIETAFGVIAANKMNAADAKSYMVETMKNSYSKGASWNGGINTAVFVVVALVVIAAVITASSGGNSGSGSSEGGYETCNTTDANDCSGFNNPSPGTYYPDPSCSVSDSNDCFGNYYYGPTDPYYYNSPGDSGP